MTKRSKYYPLLKPLLKKPAFTATEALKLNIPRNALAYFEKPGTLERVAKRIYRDLNDKCEAKITQEDLALTAYTTKNAAICLISTLNFYNMTDQIPRERRLAIPHSQRAPARHIVRAVRMTVLSFLILEPVQNLRSNHPLKKSIS